MRISYNWLKEYIDIDYSPEDLAKILTDLGLEVGSIEEYSSVKGALDGFLIGEIIECIKHPNADKLTLTKVNVGLPELLNIVCGAPNVKRGQKVVIATIGSTIYMNESSFEIKKTKIRGEVSEGMICAEDEIGLGTSHDGIMVLEDNAIPGTPAADFFNIKKDIIFEIDLTPNRIDAASHIGIARDIAAWKAQFEDFSYKKPDVENFQTGNSACNIEIVIENTEACPRYMGLCISNVKVQDSPDWLKNRLLSIDVKPINNIVDITNYVLHETGHPLHAFDKKMITGNKVIIKTPRKDSSFTTLDEIERKLSDNDLMICNSEEEMCIAGVMGGLKSGISNTTNEVFLESAYFNPSWIRRTAKRHSINTDSSFRFERGTDIDILPFAIKKAALMIKEIAGGEICGNLIDVYPIKNQKNKILFDYQQCKRAIGKEIESERIDKIIKALEIDIISRSDNKAELVIPHYRVDVTRQADINEEILRIYGYNNIDLPGKIVMNIKADNRHDVDSTVNQISAFLTANGMSEIMCNSLIKESYFAFAKHFEVEPVKLHNPLSRDLNTMRFSLLFGGLESISFNINRKNPDLKLFEFGRIYTQTDAKDENSVEKYYEQFMLGLWFSGNYKKQNWNQKEEKVDFFDLKAYCEKIINMFGLTYSEIAVKNKANYMYKYVLEYYLNNKLLLTLGEVNDKVLNNFDISQNVLFAEFNFGLIISSLKNKKTIYKPISKFPPVRRDLAVLIDKSIKYSQLKELAIQTEPIYLKEMGLFDVYSGKGIEDGKISYAMSFILEDSEKTMTDTQIDNIMNNILDAYKTNFNLILR